MDPFDDSILCHLDQPTRHQTRLAQSTSRVERAILFVFDLEVLSPEETGLRPNLNDTQHVPPISTPHWPVSGEERGQCGYSGGSKSNLSFFCKVDMNVAVLASSCLGEIP